MFQFSSRISLGSDNIWINNLNFYRINYFIIMCRNSFTKQSFDCDDLNIVSVVTNIDIKTVQYIIFQ